MCDTRALINTKQTSDLHSCWIIYTKSDGRERLTVTDTKPVMMTTDLSNNNGGIHAHSNGLLSHANGRQAADEELQEQEYEQEIVNSLDVDVDPDEDENDGTEQSLAEILDPELQPEPPIPNDAESQLIYREHRHMAKEYLSVDTNLYYAQDFKDKLIVQMDRTEREQKQELLRKMKDKEGLQSLYNNLQQQYASRQLAAGHHPHPQPHPHPHPHQHPHSHPNPHLLALQDEVCGLLPGSVCGGSESMEEGWVVIPPHHNA
ncbi:mitogen-activated protein kinase kinase kinase 7 isoform X2 [Drosophila simulans]|uniref:mitogen-activated protein kinase kinase kinase 7 isoform X2 n=1 Tax=Drosophila simulans TaxID=7240 RepID=UPI00078AE85D|nr:mitogen-activated protein kinase kinase kinase 7 isoform X2 [Drosophila simulans]KMZ10813.1 Tak1, isoform B [Drosophila simulans]